MLVLNLRAPMLAFGAVSVDSDIPTAFFPPLSLIVGLIANAMGMDRSQGDDINALQQGIHHASRIEREGTRFTDFQTAQIQSNDMMWTSHGKPTERGGGANTYESPTILKKEYWADRAVSVLIGFDDPHLEQRAAAALTAPARPLFLGRVGCPPSVRLLFGNMDGMDVHEGFGRLAPVTCLPSDSRGYLCQWPARAGDDKTYMVHDVKDWRKGMHTRSRYVRTGFMPYVERSAA